MSAYYNEIDPFAAQWLRELIKAGLIAPGDVDGRSIEDVTPNDLRGYSQCHFFAGIGGWSFALRLAGWPDDKPVWTGSCPCQPFSAAGKGAGFADERHLWPALDWLISQCRPRTIIGEQVASKDGLSWLDLVSTDLEGKGYAIGALDTCAAGFGAPHIRKRLYWVADARGVEPRRRGVSGGEESQGGEPRPGLGMGGELERMADASSGQLQEQIRRQEGRNGTAATHAENRLPSPTNGFWRAADWLFCRDGKWRPVSASPQPLVDGISESLGRVCDESVAEIEEEINAALEGKGDPTEELRNLWETLNQETQQKWQAGRIPGLHEATFLLSFLRQLSQQGWRFKECTPLSCEEAPQGEVRVLRTKHRASCPSYQHELEGWRSREHTDLVHILSSVLARHAHKAWGNAHTAYAESCSPLAQKPSQRVGRLRGYGNAIVAPQAAEFIKAVMEAKS